MLANAIKKRLSKEEGQKGFTLIELLAVIVILGIIAVIAIPLVGNIISNAKADSDVATARQVYDAARLYIAGEKDGKFNTTPATKVFVKTLQEKGYLDNGLSLPSTKATVTGGEVIFTTAGQLDSVTLAPKPLGSTSDAAVKVSESAAAVAGGSFSASQVLKSSTSTAAPTTNP
ncbi:type II secretion system protein [Paenibacillus silagei]|uniref:Type IV pilus assembly protein PilA n=1 Tax=Paenibacillus silagei TaxID=1670801 RepID=A0ABS4NKK9_9BACL|nr:type II secretion system protein [Paenibacillus silagei]MBP2109930.1 type IV pilus assembly protein PilA [Paenibacillus silagei]